MVIRAMVTALGTLIENMIARSIDRKKGNDPARTGNRIPDFRHRESPLPALSNIRN